MNASARRKLIVLPLLILAAILIFQGFHSQPVLASPQQNPWQPSGFLGAWCAQGDPTKHASITGNGPFLNLTNENGSTSSGHYMGMNNNTIMADQWNLVQGTLSPDASQINWSNGTYWTRCQSGGGGGGWWRYPNVDGTWFRDGNHSQSCYISQHRRSLNLTNESGNTGYGHTDGRWHLTTNWNGTQVNGSLSSDGNTIYWDNGTRWTR